MSSSATGWVGSSLGWPGLATPAWLAHDLCARPMCAARLRCGLGRENPTLGGSTYCWARTKRMLGSPERRLAEGGRGEEKRKKGKEKKSRKERKRREKMVRRERKERGKREKESVRDFSD